MIGERRTTVDTTFRVGHTIPQGGVRISENYIHINYIYGTTGIIGFTFQRDNGPVQRFWYVKNVFGDVTHILNNTGIVVARYSGNYGAYGAGSNTVMNFTPDNIGDINPIRYRSYYYDTETHLYYLRTRYYDPEVGRFISPDCVSVFDASRNTVNGLNLYAYCSNNPVMYYDPDGRFFKKIGRWLNNNVIKPLGDIIESAGDWFNNNVLNPFGKSVEKASDWAIDTLSNFNPIYSTGGTGFQINYKYPHGNGFYHVLGENPIKWLRENFGRTWTFFAAYGYRIAVIVAPFSRKAAIAILVLWGLVNLFDVIDFFEVS